MERRVSAGRPTNLDYRRAKGLLRFALVAGAGEGCLDLFSLLYLFSLSLSPSLKDGPI